MKNRGVLRGGGPPQAPASREPQAGNEAARGAAKGGRKAPPRGPPEAAVFWQWNNYLESRAAYAGQQVLRINMDETPVCPYQGGGSGNKLLHGSTGEHTRPHRMQVPKGLSRTFITFLAFVCNDAELQPFLPQILIASESVFKAREFERLQSQAPPNFFLIRAKSHWTNADIMGEVTELLVAIVQHLRPNAYVIWYLDTASSHLFQENLEYAFEMGLNVVPVPKKTTFLLQPLDVFLFHKFKILLRKLYRQQQASQGVAVLSLPLFLQVLYVAMEGALEAMDLEQMFARVGLGGNQAHVKRSIPKYLEAPVLPAPAREPKPADLRLVLPKGFARLPTAAFLGEGLLAIMDRPRPEGALLPPPVPGPVAPGGSRRLVFRARRVPQAPLAAPPAAPAHPLVPEAAAPPAAPEPCPRHRLWRPRRRLLLF